MMYEELHNKAENLLSAARKRLRERRHTSSNKTLNQRLSEYYSISKTTPDDQYIIHSDSDSDDSCEGENRLRLSPGNLVSRFVSDKRAACLGVSLYSDGYTIRIQGKNGIDSEPIHLSYENGLFLEYIDAGALPPQLLDLMEKCQLPLFHDGCVLAEVKDYRRLNYANNDAEVNHVILKPTQETTLADLTGITMSISGRRWTLEDKLGVEGSIMAASAEPLCLDPNPIVGLVANKLNYHRVKFCDPAIHRMARRYGKRKKLMNSSISSQRAPSFFHLVDFLANTEKQQILSAFDQKVARPCTDPWKQVNEVSLTPPCNKNNAVEKLAKCIKDPELSSDNLPVVIEEYMYETERSSNKIYIGILTILQNPTTLAYEGLLFVDRDYKGNTGQHMEKACRFPLGSIDDVSRHLKQFKDLFSEEGRKSVKETYTKPNFAPKVTHTIGCINNDSRQPGSVALPSKYIQQSSAPRAQLQLHQSQPTATSLLHQGLPLQANDHHAVKHLGVALNQLQQNRKLKQTAVNQPMSLGSTTNITDEILSLLQQTSATKQAFKLKSNVACQLAQPSSNQITAGSLQKLLEQKKLSQSNMKLLSISQSSVHQKLDDASKLVRRGVLQDGVSQPQILFKGQDVPASIIMPSGKTIPISLSTNHPKHSDSTSAMQQQQPFSSSSNAGNIPVSALLQLGNAHQATTPSASQVNVIQQTMNQISLITSPQQHLQSSQLSLMQSVQNPGQFSVRLSNPSALDNNSKIQAMTQQRVALQQKTVGIRMQNPVSRIRERPLENRVANQHAIQAATLGIGPSHGFQMVRQPSQKIAYITSPGRTNIVQDDICIQPDNLPELDQDELLNWLQDATSQNAALLDIGHDDPDGHREQNPLLCQVLDGTNRNLLPKHSPGK